MMNSDSSQVSLDLKFADIPGFKGGNGVKVRCVWGRKDVGEFNDVMEGVQIEGHDARFFVLEAN